MRDVMQVRATNNNNNNNDNNNNKEGPYVGESIKQ